MSAPAPFQRALDAARAVHLSHPDVADFAIFPDDATWRDLPANPIAAARYMAADDGIASDPLGDALIALGSVVNWRETWRDSRIGQEFLERFGCFELVGHGGHFHATTMRGFLVYAPAGLHYPWHHHPSEEMYVVLAGEAVFEVEGEAPRRLRPGGAVAHAANQPHAFTTDDKPLLAWVIWRGPDFDTGPVWTDETLR